MLGEPTLTALDFQSWDARGLAGHDPANLDMAVWLAWHDATDRIYAAAVIVDDIYFNEFSGTTAVLEGMGTHEHDSFEIMVDGDHSGGRYSSSGALEEDEFRRTYNQQAQRYGAVVESDNDKQIHLHFSSAWVQWPNEPPYADAGGFLTGGNPFISSIELFVTPFDHLIWDRPDETTVSPLSPGRTIGIGVGVIDVESEDGLSGYFAFPVAHGDEGAVFSNADLFADGLLLAGDGDGTVVQEISWGRIKAALQD